MSKTFYLITFSINIIDWLFGYCSETCEICKWNLSAILKFEKDILDRNLSHHSILNTYLREISLSLRKMFHHNKGLGIFEYNLEKPGDESG